MIYFRFINLLIAINRGGPGSNLWINLTQAYFNNMLNIVVLARESLNKIMTKKTRKKSHTKKSQIK